MAIRFLCIDPDTNGGNCPAVFIDDESEDILMQGWVETSPRTLAEMAVHSPLAENEMVVRLPARMRDIIVETLSGSRAVR